MKGEQPIGHDMDRSSQEVYDAGMAVRRQVLGDAHVDRAQERTTGFTEPFQDLITRYAWGEIWTRPGLDRRTRSCMVLTALVALPILPALGWRAMFIAGVIPAFVIIPLMVRHMPESPSFLLAKGRRDEAERLRVGGRQRLDIGLGFDQRHFARPQLAHRADDFRMTGMADQQHMAAEALEQAAAAS